MAGKYGEIQEGKVELKGWTISKCILFSGGQTCSLFINFISRAIDLFKGVCQSVGCSACWSVFWLLIRFFLGGSDKTARLLVRLHGLPKTSSQVGNGNSKK